MSQSLAISDFRSSGKISKSFCSCFGLWNLLKLRKTYYAWKIYIYDYFFFCGFHQELLKGFSSSSLKCNPAILTSDKLQNAGSRILEATVWYLFNNISLSVIEVKSVSSFTNHNL